ncbi:MAG: nitrilase-related carbon-nitrogen hydrolase [Steroidobacteraceae bacterium]
MRVTVCQWPNTRDGIARAWDALIAHVRAQSSELVLLPEMPFFPWLAASREFDAARWAAAVKAHQDWEARMPEAGGLAVLGTRPYTFGNERISAGFVWEATTGCRAAHANSCIRNEQGAWEQAWYAAATPEFTPVQVGPAELGFLIGTELWDEREAVRYGEAGVQFLITPRTSTVATQEEWLAAGSDAAVRAGAFGLSSNRVDDSGTYAGRGWIVAPDGELLACTTPEEPFATLEVETR